VTDAQTLDERDYALNPSINFPASLDEARLALVQSFFRSCTEESHRGHPLSREFTTDAGFGMNRTAEQAEWLEQARDELLVRFGEVLNSINADIDKDAIRAARA
jgi:hypothetical protein